MLSNQSVTPSSGTMKLLLVVVKYSVLPGMGPLYVVSRKLYAPQYQLIQAECGLQAGCYEGRTARVGYAVSRRGAREARALLTIRSKFSSAFLNSSLLSFLRWDSTKFSKLSARVAIADFGFSAGVAMSEPFLEDVLLLPIRSVTYPARRIETMSPK